jgi:hypothetical protein
MDDVRTATIQQAVTAGEFQRALHLWNEYAAHLRQKLGSGSLAPEEMEEAGRLVAWSREVALCARARALDQLASLRVAAQYTEPTPPETPRLIRMNL